MLCQLFTRIYTKFKHPLMNNESSNELFSNISFFVGFTVRFIPPIINALSFPVFVVHSAVICMKILFIPIQILLTHSKAGEFFCNKHPKIVNVYQQWKECFRSNQINIINEAQNLKYLRLCFVMLLFCVTNGLNISVLGYLQSYKSQEIKITFEWVLIIHTLYIGIFVLLPLTSIIHCTTCKNVNKSTKLYRCSLNRICLWKSKICYLWNHPQSI